MNKLFGVKDHNFLSVDGDNISRRTLSNTSAGQKYYNRRKSSIPYAGRQPKVRFLRQVEPVLEHNPLPPSSGFPVKPILKKSEFPILVDLSLLESPLRISDYVEGQNYLTTNDELEGCAATVESLVKIFSKAERQARGAVDILTFPVAAGCLEPLSRFEGSIIVSVLSVEKISTLAEEAPEADRQVSPLLKLLELIEELLGNIHDTQVFARNLKKASLSRYLEWANLLKRKGDFRIDHKRTETPLYSKKTMPENVTMYEDILSEEKRYKFDGSTRIFRNGHDIILLTDVQDEEFMKYPEEIDEEQLQVIAESVVEHAKDLVLYAQKNIEMAIETLGDSGLDTGFQYVKDRIIHLEFDAFFDPLCALELKNNLGDVVERKGELLNISEHTEKYLRSMEKSTKKFQKFCVQVSTEITTRSKTKPKCLGCVKPMSVESCLKSLAALGDKDFMISIPLSDDFERTVFHLEPTPTESRTLLRLHLQ